MITGQYRASPKPLGRIDTSIGSMGDEDKHLVDRPVTVLGHRTQG